ncbi:MAG: histidine kinase [Bacteroidota bacterium]|jgi:CheY-like chemotaxis protein|nr:histidine kinase [Bacteroidota bacterium]
MKPTGVFLFVDDDPDEHELLQIAVKRSGYTNHCVFCSNGQEALDFLRTTNEEVFVVLSDLNMPVMDGLELKRAIENDNILKSKAIPFIFHSSTGNPEEIKTAYSLNIQGYFAKSMKLEGTIKSLNKIVDFWTDCIHPKDLS